MGTNRYVNVTALTWTPSGGSATTITGTTQLGFDPAGSVIKFSGDGDRLPTTVIGDYNDPKVTLNGADIIKFLGLANGARGKLEWKIPDAKGGVSAGGGGYQFTSTTTGAVIVNTPVQSQHRQFASGSVEVAFESADGVTMPISFTAL